MIAFPSHSLITYPAAKQHLTSEAWRTAVRKCLRRLIPRGFRLLRVIGTRWGLPRRDVGGRCTPHSLVGSQQVHPKSSSSLDCANRRAAAPHAPVSYGTASSYTTQLPQSICNTDCCAPSTAATHLLAVAHQQHPAQQLQHESMRNMWDALQSTSSKPQKAKPSMLLPQLHAASITHRTALSLH